MKMLQVLSVVTLVASMAIAQSPDVIVGELNGMDSYGSSGGIYAYSIGTTSCNIGTLWLNWFAGTNQHPVIGQNFYRLKSGRFEQIGMSWLKHGFFALSGNLCFNDCQGTNGDHLGVHCSDPYDAGLNGSQGNGPRNEVNATTGNFPYPFAGSYPSAAPTIGRRLQCAAADVNPALNSGALYWAEGQYVTPDDAAAGNKHNNASYRRITFGASSTNHPASFIGATVQQLPAIYAWQVQDPQVVLTNHDDPQTGRFIIGKRVTSLGGGNYHYEFAIMNLNSERSGRGFTVDFPVGTTVTNAGFKDIAYHSGEPFSGTDWVGTVNANSINWATTQTYIQNVNANALRWGTVYNFWCDATASAETNKTIEYFKPEPCPADPVVPSSSGYTLNSAAPFDNPTLTLPVNGPSGDDDNALVPLGFSFNFYGTSYTQVYISTNGFLTFAGAGASEYNNSCIPGATAPNALIAGYWDDLVPTVGQIKYQTLGSAPNRRFVAWWNAVPLYNDASKLQSFKIILDETTNKVTTSIISSTVGGESGGASATHGVENQTGASGTQASCNVAASAIASTSHTFTPFSAILPSADLTVSGSTGPNGVLTWSVNSNALGAPLILIASTDPGPLDLGPLGMLNIGLTPGAYFVLADGSGLLQPANPADVTNACGDWTLSIPLGPGGLPAGLTIYNQGVILTTTSTPLPPNGQFHITDEETITT